MSSLAQTKDSLKFVIIDARPIDPHAKPLIIMDGKVYKGSMKDIDTNEISSVDVLRDSSATALYGKKAANGVVIIKTKKYKGIDTANQSKRVDSVAGIRYASISEFAKTLNPRKITYVINGELMPDTLLGKAIENIKPQDILKLQILKNVPNKDKHISEDKATVIIITRAFAVKEYQNKFISLCKNYGEYIQLHNDSDMFYVINGKSYQTRSNETLGKLYDLPLEKIKKINFLDNYKLSGIQHPVLIITTKK
ncbi:MAG TPA: TonB-dependent receptor plug domain-containing protein [Mucilaginibacter sp.]|nr:TonB-dependent receptor plug domain-containing protein [Mucilaginibacter sp.]